jgi:general secretion pathway protein G
MTATRTIKKGFTLIEILIVVIILGILAAIVIPQFANASTEAKKSSLKTTVQTLRSQIALYKLQHNDKLPGAGNGTAFSSAQFWTDLTTKTDSSGAASSAADAVGPYMQSISKNPLVASANGDVVANSTVTTGAAPAATAYLYDFGGGTGKIFGVDASVASAPVVLEQ